MIKSFFQYLSFQTILIATCIIKIFFLFIIRRKNGYGLVTLRELNERLEKLSSFLSIVYLTIFMLWGMFILPIKSMTGIIPTLRSLLFMLAAITIAYVVHKVIFYHKAFVYVFAIASTIFITTILLRSEDAFKNILTSAFL